MSLNLKISTIGPNLRPEEYHLQLADSLLQFKNIKESTLERIRVKVAKKQEYLKSFQLRIKQCQDRVENLRGRQDATKIYNKSKYPGEESFHFSETLFSFIEHLGDIKHRYHEVQSKFDQLEITVKPIPPKSYHFPRTIKQAKANRIGIGGPPSNLPCISSLLLFNTNVHVYKKYTITSPLEDASILAGSKDDDGENRPTAPGDAPYSLAAGNDGTLWIPPRQDLFYMPGLGAVPALDSLPEILPDLGGVALNSGFTLESGPSLAPSAALIDPSLLSALPEIVNDVSIDEHISLNSNFPTITADQSHPPPPPPPPPSLAPPPPPPPPPPQSHVLSSVPTISDHNEPVDIGRNDLLRQIVETGGLAGAKLKSSKKESKRKKASSSKKKGLAGEENGTDVPVSMLEDLQRRLRMRRMGMVGKSNENDDANDDNDKGDSALDIKGVFQKLSDKIPHYDKSRDSNAKNDKDDSDWSDN